MNSDAHMLRAAITATVVALVLPLAAWGHEGHEHEAPAAAPPRSAAPRFAAATELFELVGVLEGRRLVLWLDRFADNAPVTGAHLELELGGRALEVHADGDRYVAQLPAPPAPGSITVTAFVRAGAEDDLLAGALVVPAPTDAVSAGETDAPARPFGAALASPPADWWLLTTLAMLAAGVLGWLAGRWGRWTRRAA